MEAGESHVKQEQRPAVVITGASSGIGRDIALLAAKDCTAVLVARSFDALETVASDIRLAGHEALVVILDLADPMATTALADALSQAGLYCDVLVNNAGYGLIGKSVDLSPKGQLGIVDVNIRALSALTLAFLPDMKKRGRGGILNVSSVSAFGPGPGLAFYYASKAFVLSLSEALWQELRGTGVTVTVLCPGPVETAFFARATGGARKPLLFRLLPTMTSEAVALAGWRGFKIGKRVVFPSYLNRVSAILMRIIPNWLYLPGMMRLQASRYKSKASA
jgi:uncharacterized protein